MFKTLKSLKNFMKKGKSANRQSSPDRAKQVKYPLLPLTESDNEVENHGETGEFIMEEVRSGEQSEEIAGLSKALKTYEGGLEILKIFNDPKTQPDHIVNVIKNFHPQLIAADQKSQKPPADEILNKDYERAISSFIHRLPAINDRTQPKKAEKSLALFGKFLRDEAFPTISKQQQQAILHEISFDVNDLSNPAGYADQNYPKRALEIQKEFILSWTHKEPEDLFENIASYPDEDSANLISRRLRSIAHTLKEATLISINHEDMMKINTIHKESDLFESVTNGGSKEQPTLGRLQLHAWMHQGEKPTGRFKLLKRSSSSEASTAKPSWDEKVTMAKKIAERYRTVSENKAIVTSSNATERPASPKPDEYEFVDLSGVPGINAKALSPLRGFGKNWVFNLAKTDIKDKELRAWNSQKSPDDPSVFLSAKQFSQKREETLKKSTSLVRK